MTIEQLRSLNLPGLENETDERLSRWIRQYGTIFGGMESFSFNGQNCNDISDDADTCSGWDGQDRRCDCGNRRVSWEYDDQYGWTAEAW